MDNENTSFGIHIGNCDFSAQYVHTSRVPSFRFHHHSVYEFYVFLHGKVKICIENMLFEAAPNSLFIFPPNCLHGLLGMDDRVSYERMYFHVQPEFIARLSNGKFSALRSLEQAVHEMHLIFTLEEKQSCGLYETIRQIDELSSGDNAPIADLQRKVLLSGALLQMIGTIERQRKLGVDTPYQKHPFISPVLQYINDHFTESITLDDIAEHVNVSMYHLVHEFKRLTNNTIMTYVIAKRLQYALKLLNTGMPTLSACFQSGFSSYSNFSKSFRAYFGVSPRSFSSLSNDWFYESSSSQAPDIGERKNG